MRLIVNGETKPKETNATQNDCDDHQRQTELRLCKDLALAQTCPVRQKNEQTQRTVNASILSSKINYNVIVQRPGYTETYCAEHKG